MKVVAAGRNLDEELLEEWRGLGREALAVIQTGGGGENEELLRHLAAWARREDLTPETLSAAYARISRDPRDVGELRRIAVDVEHHDSGLSRRSGRGGSTTGSA